MRNLPIYEDYRLFESAGPLASSFKRVGFKEMTRTDFEGFGGVQEGGLIYDGGENFIVLYGLATDDSKPVVCVMYGNDPYDQVEAHILNQAEQKAFISKLSSFTKEMDRLCALPAGTEKTDGIKSWLRKFGFQVISSPVMNESRNQSKLAKEINESTSIVGLKGWMPVRKSDRNEDDGGAIDIALKELKVSSITDLAWVSDADGPEETYGKIMAEISELKPIRKFKVPGFVGASIRKYNGYEVLVLNDYGADMAFARQKDIK